MSRIYQPFYIVLLFAFTSSIGLSQSYWKNIREYPTSVTNQRDHTYLPKKYEKFELSYEVLKEQLMAAPREFGGNATSSIMLPSPEGKLIHFNVVESPCMHEELSAKYPSIKSYKAYSDDKRYVSRFDIGPYGMHASIRTPEGEIYVDPFLKDNNSYYVVYYTKDHNEPTDLLPACGTTSLGSEERDHMSEYKVSSREDAINLHTFDLALACTGEWGSQRGTIETALADMNTSVNRLNQIFENEFASRFILIAQNDKLIHLAGATDPYTSPTMGGALLTQNTQVINFILGSANLYDLGHIYTGNCTDVGGIAFLSSLCSGNKGAGVTCHYAELLYITVQVAAHEMGHQLGANHTFNNCGGNENLANGFEPGGGSTIMSYANLCGENSFVNRADPYYNQASLTEIYELSRFTDGGAYGCSTKVPTSNHAPTVEFTSPALVSIPISTPFILEGKGTDMDNDALTYNIEEKDAGSSQCTLGEPTGNCPLFRSAVPQALPYRFFPNKSSILSATNSKSEVLPTTKRDLNFSITARDNNTEGGVAVWNKIKIKVDNTAGPFKVISPNIGETYEVGERVNVKWDVANTNNAVVNCQKVNIYLSQFGGLHDGENGFTLLVPNADNDGEEEIIIPNVTLGVAKIVVRAADNIFFDVSDFNFTIKAATKPVAYFSISKFSEDLCLPASSEFTINTEGFGGYNGKIAFKTDALPEGIEGVFSNSIVDVGQSTNVKFTVANSVSTGTYKIVLKGLSDLGDSIQRNYYLNVISTDFSDLVSLLPEDGDKNSEGPKFTWTKSFNGTSYTIEIASDPTFIESSIVYRSITSDTTYKAPATFPKKMIYFWRVKTENSCGSSSYTSTRTFGTAILSCTTFNATGLPLNFSASGKPTIESNINVPNSGKISDINIKAVTLDHDNFADLVASLVAPSGKQVRLFTNKCPKKWNVSFTMDDQAPQPFSCTITNGNQFRPQEMLNSLNGEEINGVWKLKVEDTASGNGGKLSGFTLELCGDIALSTPELIRNNVLQIQPLNKPFITTTYLEVIDAETGAENLSFTLVNNVQFGRLQKNGVDMIVGTKFTQKDINDGTIRYLNESTTSNDGFYFIVEDGTGAWTGTHKFSIEIDGNFASDVKDLRDEISVKMIPNPASSFADIVITGDVSKINRAYIYDMYGKLIQQHTIDQQIVRINTSSMLSGMYIVTLTNGKEYISAKLAITAQY